MKWSDLGDIVGKAAPALVTALGCPTGGALGTALASLLGSDPTPESVQAAIDSNPEWHLKAQALEVEMQKAVLADRDSARQMNIAAIQNGRGEIQERLAYALIVMGFALVAAVLFVPAQYIDDQTRTWAFPFAQSIISMVVGFYFGSTQWANKNARHPGDTKPSLYDRIGK